MTLDEDSAPMSRNPGARPLDPSRHTAKRGLARGLDSLIPGSSSADSNDGQNSAPIGSISPNPSQPRQDFDQEQLEALAASIREHGILQPLLVRPNESGGYDLIAGERRWRAAGLAGVDTVPIVVQEDTNNDQQENLTLALVENIQRSDLNPIELANAFEQLSDAGWTQQKIALQVGKSRASVANLMRLLQLPDSVRAFVATGSLSEGHGRALLPAPMSERPSLAEQAVERGWTVRQLEEAVRKLTETETEPALPTSEASPLVLGAVRRLEAALGTKVEVRVGRNGTAAGGRIVVHWYDEEQLDALASQISGSRLEDVDDPDSFGV